MIKAINFFGVERYFFCRNFLQALKGRYILKQGVALLSDQAIAKKMQFSELLNPIRIAHHNQLYTF